MGSCHILVALGIYTKKMPMRLNIPPSIWQSYINATLDCLQSREYYEAIMDDLLLFSPNKEITYSQIIRFITGDA